MFSNVQGGSLLASRSVPLTIGDLPSPLLGGGTFHNGTATNTNTALPMPGHQISKYKVAETSSPIPRDRIFLNYSLFHNTPLSRPGVRESLDIHRFVPGIEKTFVDGNTSVEVRFPFAASLSNDVFGNLTGTRGGQLTDASKVEFGNIVVNLKALLFETCNAGYSAGLSLELPTADDSVYHDDGTTFAPGTPIVEIENESVHVAPWIGSVHTPSDRLFVQTFLQVDIDANGNTVRFPTATFDPTSGRWNSPTFLFADLSAGYWLHRATRGSGEKIRGLAAIAELHYNSSLQSTDVVFGGAGTDPLALGTTGAAGAPPIRRLESLNASIGGTVELAGNTSLTVAYVAPLTGGLGRPFDGEFRVTLNRFFGPRNRIRRPVFP